MNSGKVDGISLKKAHGIVLTSCNGQPFFFGHASPEVCATNRIDCFIFP
jgi:hypothetical protein